MWCASLHALNCSEHGLTCCHLVNELTIYLLINSVPTRFTSASHCCFPPPFTPGQPEPPLTSSLFQPTLYLAEEQKVPASHLLLSHFHHIPHPASAKTAPPLLQQGPDLAPCQPFCCGELCSCLSRLRVPLTGARERRCEQDLLLANCPSGEAGTRQRYLTDSIEQDYQEIADSISH